MKKIIITLTMLSTMLFAFDYAGIAASVNGDKAMESVDKEKAMAAVAKGSDISVQDVQESVDGDKAIESVDKEKLMKSVIGF